MEKATYAVRADTVRNRLYVTLSGFFTLEEIRRFRRTGNEAGYHSVNVSSVEEAEAELQKS